METTTPSNTTTAAVSAAVSGKSWVMSVAVAVVGEGDLRMLLSTPSKDGTIEEEVEEEESAIPCSNGWFFFVIYGPLYAIICCFGLLGNSLSFGVLHRHSRNNVSTFLLKALAVSDNIFLFTAGVVQMYPAMAVYSGSTEHLRSIYSHYQMFAWPLAHIVQFGTVWMMVLVAANRYIAVCYSLHAQRLCSKRKVEIQIAVIAVASVVYSIPRFIEYRYGSVNVTDVRDNTTQLLEINVGLASQHVYNILYENVAYCLFVFLLPLIILVVFNAHLLRELKRSQRLRKTLRKKEGRTNSDENNITLVMIVIIVVFILCQTPASANQILYYVTDAAAKSTCSTYMKYYHLCNLLITMNSSLNFIVYCLFRRQFQQQLRYMMGCRSTFRTKAIVDAGNGRRSAGRLPTDSCTNTSTRFSDTLRSVSTTIRCQLLTTQDQALDE